MFPTEPIAFFRNFDFVTLAMLMPLFVILLCDKQLRSNSELHSISHKVAASKQSLIIYASVMSIAVPVYYCCIWFWLLPSIEAPVWLYIMLLPTFACEILFIWVAPQHTLGIIHSAAAGFVFLMTYVLLLALVLYGMSLHPLSRVMILITLAGGAIATTIIWKSKRRHFFLIECIYSVLFLLAISCAVHFP